MGFYLRKSFSVGPFRFNLSKSGIGMSAGVKGLRIGSGPRGNYVHIGRGGLYYRTSLPSGGGRPVPSVPPPSDITNDLHEPLQDIESVSVLNMSDSSSASLLEELNEKRSKVRLWPIASVIGLFVLLVIGNSFNTLWPVYAFVPITLAAIYLAYMRDQVTKTTVLFYELEQEQEQKYQVLHDAFDRIVGCGGKWHIEARGVVKDRKRSAGASSVVKRNKIKPAKGNPPYVKSNISIPFLPVGKQLLYFFPDRMLVFDPNGVGAVGYNDLKIDVASTRFIEEETVPLDTVVVDRTWKYVNKNGGPDKRFNNNRELPIVMYESIHLNSPSGLNELIHCSKEGVGEGFKNAVYNLSKMTENQNSN